MLSKGGTISRLYQIYRRALARRPFLVDAVQTGAIMATADFISQSILERKSVQNIDVKRLVGFTSIGFFLCGPLLRLWFGYLDKKLVPGKKNTEARIVVKKVFLDQLIFAPVYVALIFVAMGYVKGKSLDDIKNDLSTKYVDVMILNYCIWPLLQVINFYFIPIEYQVLVMSVFSLLWDTYLAWKLNR